MNLQLTLLSSAKPRSTVRHASSTPATPRPPIPQEVVRRRAPLAPVEEVDPSEPASAAAVDPAVLSDETRTFEPPSVSLTQQQLSLLYAYTNPPPESALAAFAARVSLPDLSLLSSTTADDEAQLALIEQALIHESFWDGVRNLQDQVALSDAYHRKFTNFHDRPLSSSSSPALTPTLTDRPTYAHNGALAALGNSLLGTFATELVLESFPHLPTRAAKAALTLYVGPKSLAQVAQLVWGVGPSRNERALVGREEEGKVSRKERAYGHLVQGRGGARKAGNEVGAKEGAAGPGLIRWNRKVCFRSLSRCVPPRFGGN